MTRGAFPLAGVGVGILSEIQLAVRGRAGMGGLPAPFFRGNKGRGFHWAFPASDAGPAMAAEGIFFVGLTCKPFPFPYIKPAFAESAHSSVG